MSEKELIGLYTKYLMSSYLYYEANERSPWTDIQFDFACKTLLENWDNFEHNHKHLTDKEALAAGTGYQIKEYPLITKNCAWLWLKDCGYD